MKQTDAEIRHAGRVVGVSGSQIKVQILTQTACSGCQAKAVCGALLLTLPMFFENELVIGLGALGFVALYYLVLAQFRDKLNSGFIFTVEKIK